MRSADLRGDIARREAAHRWSSGVVTSFFLLWSFCGSACLPSDPGWGYHVLKGRLVQAEDGPMYEVPEKAEVQARVNGSLFAGGLNVDIDIVNRGADPLEVDLEGVVVRDANGQSLRRGAPSPNVRCQGEIKGVRCILAGGQSCRLARQFRVKPLSRHLIFFQEPNPDLRQLSVGVTSLQRRGQQSKMDIQFIWDLAT
jgi:hypothetical protein